jgi:pimeloyl-ACP methyl ester carboxylesterase
MLHGVCNPPGYACGHIWPSSVEQGFLVCPTGNGRCAWSCTDCSADRKDGPPSWEESFDDADRDLEKAIAKVDALHPGEVDRDGAILMGFSRGAWIALHAARKHPNRWPYLVLIEADVQVAASSLRGAGVRSVALVAGGWGLNLKGMGDNAEQLVKDGVRAKLFVMPKAGHHYSEGIDELLREIYRWLRDADGGLSESPGARP